MTAQVLLPVDGNGARTQRALAEAIRIHRQEEVPVFLLSVQPLVSPLVASYFGHAELERLQQDAGLEELAPARAIVEAAGVWHRTVVRVGRRAETIANTARELGCDRIILGAAGGGVFGSMAQQVGHLLAGSRRCRIIVA
jgi:nucleotide-binding universal stress UspA family protein